MKTYGAEVRGLSNFLADPDYVLRWPASVFADEATRLVRRARANGTGTDWQEEVLLLLRQAFSSVVPREDFKRVLAAEHAVSPYDEELF